jgi:protein-disulfide isomerase
MESRIAELEARDPDSFRIVHHQLPILGASSTTASRAVLAAQKQGAYREMHERLIRTPAVTDVSYVTAIAASIGLDADQFTADLNSVEVKQALQKTEAIARVFGFYGTPAFAVGRTVFLGAIPTPTLQALIANEVDNPCQTS